MTKLEKGDFGYIKNKKKKLVAYLAMVILLALGIFFLGLVLNDFSKKNIFSVLAMLMVLPGAKILTSLIVIWPHKALDSIQYKELEERIKGNSGLLYGMVLTSSEKVMHIKAMAVLEESYIILPCEKQDTEYMKAYIKKHMYNYGFDKKVEIKKDYNAFKKAIDNKTMVDKENIDKIKNKLMILQI